MTHQRFQKRILKAIDPAPVLKDIFLAADPLEVKRAKTYAFLDAMLREPFDENSAIPPMEWILARDAILTLKNMLSARSERLADFSLFKYIDDLINRSGNNDHKNPSEGFFVELEHLLRGVMGKAGIYSDKLPAFQKYEGRRAATLRSKDLSRMMRAARGFMDRYACGLDEDVVRQRSKNKTRILKHFKATELEWGKWTWQVSHVIRDADTLASLVELTAEEYQGISLAHENRIPFGVTPYYASLIDQEPGTGRDTAVRKQVIPSPQYVTRMKELRDRSEPTMDFMLERDTSPVDGITRRYPGIVILKPILACPQICVYCQRNWEIEEACSPDAAMGRKQLDKAIEWIANTPEIIEVLITGGDPLLLPTAYLENLLFRLSKIRHVERIRIGTRTPVTLPQRITDSLVRDINHFHHPGKREIIIVSHFEHPYEITPQCLEAVQKFRRYGIDIYNQLVFTFYNSRKFEAALLRHKLRLIGVTPYYTFNTKGKEETDEYRVPLVRLLQEQQEEARLLPGTVRTDEIVFNVPSLGKNYLRARQNHDLISILPDGKRVYEFHPWEKNLTLVDTYVYTDVSIYDYIKRLQSIGENPADYKTIWYYY